MEWLAVILSKSFLLFLWPSGCVHRSWIILSKLKKGPTSGYSLTSVIQIKIVIPWIFYTVVLVMHLGMRLALSWFVVVLLWHGTHPKLFTVVFFSREFFPCLYSNICFSVPSVIPCPCNYGNSHCWLQTIPPIYHDHFSILSPRVSALLSHPFWPVKAVYLPMSIFSVNYIDCFCSQPCPEQSKYSFIPEKINLISIFWVNFNIKEFCINFVLREDSTANKVKTSVLNV